MLELIIGTDWVANRDAVLQLVSQDVHARRNGIVIMVPELVSHDMERRLCETAGDTASRYAEILPFSRLANRISESVGHAALSCMDNGGRIVAMAATARQLHSKLKTYASVESRPEFLTGMVEVVDEFKRCCITPQDLMEASKKSEGVFAQKLEELSLILEAYDALCSRGDRDPGDQMNWVLEQLEGNDFAKNRIFYIDGFPDFTRQHFAVIEHLIRNSHKVTVSINCDRQGSHKLAFEKAGSTAAALIRAAQESGVSYNIRTIQEDTHALTDMCQKLFQGQIEKGRVSSDRLLLTCADSVYEECQNAATRVMELVRKGSRYRDIGIVCADMSSYANVLDLVFERCGIPIYRSGKEDVLQNTVISTVLCAMDAALGGFESLDVIQYLKSPLSPLDFDTVDRIENYAIMWGINGKGWTEHWEYDPDGLTDTISARSQEMLRDLDCARAVAIDPLVELHKAFKNAVKLDDQVDALRRFFEVIQIADRLEALAADLDRQGDNRGAQILNQLWEILLNAMDQLQDVLGETVWDADVFTHLFTLLLSQYDVGTIPPVLDAVTAGPVSAMRCHQVSHQIVLGAKEGTFPGYSGSSGVLTDQERDALRAMGVGLTGGGMEGLQAEFAEIYGVFCAARESVMVSYSAGQPSYVYRRLLELAEKETVLSEFISPDATDVAVTLIRCADEKTAEELSLTDCYRDISRRADYRLGTISERNIEKLYGRSLRLSASQVDRQAECRFCYFMNYGLKARERKEITVDPAEFGTYVHAVLEKTAAEVMQSGGFHEVSLEKTMGIAKRHSEEYTAARFSKLDSKRITYLFQRNMQELDAVVTELWKELHLSEFEPYKFELGFGDGKEMAAIDISGNDMNAVLRGFVDRIDIWNDADRSYFRVVDYKTGAKDFDYCDVFNGVGLQMLLYLFALEENGEEILGNTRTSAGVQYFPARAPMKSSGGKVTQEEAEALHADHLKRKGLVLAEENVLQAMQPDGAPKRLSCKKNKEGQLQGDIATSEQLRQLKTYVFRYLSKLVDEIASGIVEPNPYIRGNEYGICMWCPYKSVCHYLYVKDKRIYKTMTSQRFWEEIGRELKQNG